MAHAPQPSTAQHLERIARDIHDLAFDFAEPARSVAEYEGRRARGEDLCDELRAVVRGDLIDRWV